MPDITAQRIRSSSKPRIAGSRTQKPSRNTSKYMSRRRRHHSLTLCWQVEGSLLSHRGNALVRVLLIKPSSRILFLVTRITLAIQEFCSLQLRHLRKYANHSILVLRHPAVHFHPV